jgi:hypothetical protein
VAPWRAAISIVAWIDSIISCRPTPDADGVDAALTAAGVPASACVPATALDSALASTAPAAAAACDGAAGVGA